MSSPNPTTFLHSTPATTINNFLENLSSLCNSNFYIHPHVVAYTNLGNKELQIQRACTEDLPDYQACDAITHLKDNLPTDGALIFFTGHIEPAVEFKDHEDPSNSWHSFILIYKDSKVVIYDPNWVPQVEGGPKRRITQMKRLTLLRPFMKILTTPRTQEVMKVKMKGDKRGKSHKGWGRSVSKIQIGGGGNEGTDCTKMSACWAETFVKTGCMWNFEEWEELRK